MAERGEGGSRLAWSGRVGQRRLRRPSERWALTLGAVEVCSVRLLGQGGVRKSRDGEWSETCPRRQSGKPTRRPGCKSSLCLLLARLILGKSPRTCLFPPVLFSGAMWLQDGERERMAPTTHTQKNAAI